MPTAVARISRVWRPDTPEVSPGVSTNEPTRPITPGSSRGQSAPSSRQCPADGRDRPSKQRMVVVFPDPFGPRNPNTPPAGTDRFKSSTARTRPGIALAVLLAQSLDFDDRGHATHRSCVMARASARGAIRHHRGSPRRDPWKVRVAQSPVLDGHWITRSHRAPAESGTGDLYTPTRLRVPNPTKQGPSSQFGAHRGSLPTPEVVFPQYFSQAVDPLWGIPDRHFGDTSATPTEYCSSVLFTSPDAKVVPGFDRQTRREGHILSLVPRIGASAISPPIGRAWLAVDAVSAGAGRRAPSWRGE